MLDRNTWNHLTVGKQMCSNKLFKNKTTNKLFAYELYIYIYIYMHIYKQYLVLNNPYMLIYHKRSPTQLFNYVLTNEHLWLI